MFLSFVLRWGAPLLLAVFPLPVVAQLVVVILRAAAKKTTNKLDDDLVKVLERYFNIPKEEEVKDENR